MLLCLQEGVLTEALASTQNQLCQSSAILCFLQGWKLERVLKLKDGNVLSYHSKKWHQDC